VPSQRGFLSTSRRSERLSTEFPWDESRLVVSAASHLLCIGNRATLFCERRQQLFGLNPTADLIWRSLAKGTQPGQVQRELVDLGLTDAQAESFIQDATSSWVNGGQLTPGEVLDQLAQPPNDERHVWIHDLKARINFFGDATAEPFDAVFSQFSSGESAPGFNLSLVGCKGRFFIFDGGKPLGAFAPRQVIPELKAVLTEQYVAAVQNSFLFHGAFVVRRSRSLLLCGSPGAGKTTLSVALVGTGYEYCSDDIVRLERDGKARGIPFSPAVKRDAWPLVAPYAPEIDRLPTYHRADGQDVRYLPVRNSNEASREINYVFLLARRPGATVALETIEPLEVVSTILESAFSTKRSIEAAALVSFARMIEAAGCYRLVYTELPETVRAIDALIRE